MRGARSVPAPETFPEYTPAERRADAVVHAVGNAMAIVGAAVLLAVVLPTGDVRPIVACLVYVLGMLAMFGFSAAYNLCTEPAWKSRFRRCDHAAIFLMIAGTYTPFTIVSIGGPVGYGLLAVVWSVAIAGAVCRLVCPQRIERVSVAIYLLLGWVGILAGAWIVAAMPVAVLVLLGAGGLLYTTGVVFHLWSSLDYNNAIWHVFVLAAAFCHYGAVVGAVAAA